MEILINILWAVSSIISIVTCIYCAYFTVTGILGVILKNKITFKKATKKNHFAIIIPARNESAVIGNLVDSLNSVNYPKDKYDVYVVPNNCTDNTKDIAINAGANIIECTIKTKTKGDVLKFVFDKLKNNKEIDAYIIFDADNVVHPDFLTHMNDAIESGYNVAEGYRDAKNPSDNWLSGSYAIFYLIQNVFFNHARMSLNSSSSVNGTGFMVTKDYIDKVGFETYTLTEDVEFTGQCALRGEKIVFVEDAITYDEYPVNFVPSWRQRKRWSAGNIECMKRYSWKLLKNAFKNGSMASLDMSLTYCGALILVVNFANIILSGIVTLLAWNIDYFKPSLFGIFMLLVFDTLVNIFALIYKKKKILPIIKGLLLFFVFILSWIPINMICLIKKYTKWEEIKHNRNVNIKDVLNK